MKIIVALLVLISSITSTPALADITTGLIAWYPFDGNMQDASGNNNHGSAVGGLVLTTDRNGNLNSAYEFNGNNSYVVVPNSPSLSSPDTAVTQAAWIRLYGPSQIGQPFGPVIMKSTSAANAFMYRMTVSPGALGIAINDWFTFATSPQTMVLQRWYHVATVFNGTTVKFYVDGAVVDSSSLAVTITPDARDLTIGGDVPGILEIFYGKIDDVRIYSRALSDADIAELCPVPVGIHDGGAPAYAPIQRSYPNPSSGHTQVDILLRSTEFIELTVHDIRGRRVRTLRSGILPAGPHTLTWDGRNRSGEHSPSGVYFFRLHAEGTVFSSRVIKVQ